MKQKASLIVTGLVLGIIEAALGWFLAPANLLGYLLIFTGLGYCIGGGIFLAATRPAANGQPGDWTAQSDRTLLALAPGALLILIAVPLEYAFLPASLPRTRIMQWGGILIILSGFALRIWTRQYLKEAYHGNLQVLRGQQVVTGGPYRWVRHPAYLGFILMALGMAVGFSSLAGLLGVVLLATGFLFRCRVEERMLVQSFGDTYVSYQERTGLLVPRFDAILFSQNRKKYG